MISVFYFSGLFTPPQIWSLCWFATYWGQIKENNLNLCHLSSFRLSFISWYLCTITQMTPLHLLSRLLYRPVTIVTMVGGMNKERHVWVFLDYHCVKTRTARNWNFPPGILSWEAKDEVWSQPEEELVSWKEVSHNFDKSWCHLVGKTEAKTRMGQWWVRPHLGQHC